MIKIFKEHKKLCIIIGIILAFVFSCLYLRALFLTGLWHKDAFLYRCDDGSFIGSDVYAEYKMVIKPADYGKDIEFSVNNKINHYQIKYDENDLNRNVEILKNGVVICKGRALEMEDSWIVIDNETGSSDMMSVQVGDKVPALEELYPNYTSLYNWAVSDKTDIRGNLYMTFLIILLGGILFLDIKFPMLFWILEHSLDVDGGEPSAWYLFGQRVGRVLLSLAISVCIVMTFTTH